MPSDKLQKEYSQSNLNKELSLPPFEVVNKLIEMSRETYNSMKQRYLSKPLFNFLFNPSIKTEIGVGKGTKGSKYIEWGFFISGTVRTWVINIYWSIKSIFDKRFLYELDRICKNKNVLWW